MKDHGRSTRSRTGGRLRPNSGKRKHQLGREPTETGVGEPTLRTVDARGDREKVRALATDRASVAVDGETRSTEIEDVVENPANPNYVRRNIVTKGALVETGEGTARVTSRPGQDGQVNAVLEDG
ncbi:30S ribosomal protein S8e [Halobacteriales archaeon QS_4_69_34]|nr:MAG: 30S ribosomal protein S8e [Halobacteriales archaeon QS_4_69_34]